MFQRLARVRQLLLILSLLHFLLVQLVLQGETLAELIKLTLVLFLLVHPWRDIFLNIQRYVQGSAGFHPLFSECLLFLRESLRFVRLALDLLSQGINLSQHQQAFLFQRGHLFFQGVPAALVIRQLKRLVLLNGGMLAGAAQRAGFACLKLRTVVLQVFNRRFTFAQGLQVQIVLVFLFVLLAAQRQRFIEFALLRLGFLYAFIALAQALLQRLIASV